jgi:hypothetical protein
MTKATAEKTELSRYLARLAAMARMAEDNTIGGQREVAAARLEVEAAKYEQFGFATRAQAMAAALGVEEIFNPEEFEVDQIPVKKGSPTWVTYLVHACAYQSQCCPVSGSGFVRVHGPVERIELTKWLIDQLKADMERGAKAAWEALDIDEKYETTYRRFKHAYCTGIAGALLDHEQKRYKNERSGAYSPDSQAGYAQSGKASDLVTNRANLSMATYKFALTKSSFSSYTAKAQSSSGAGTSAGASDLGRYANRRMTSGARSIAGA